MGGGGLAASWCCGNHFRLPLCYGVGFFFFSLSFQSFVLSHLVIAPVRMIPTFPSPKSTLALTSHLGQNVSLEER